MVRVNSASLKPPATAASIAGVHAPSMGVRSTAHALCSANLRRTSSYGRRLVVVARVGSGGVVAGSAGAGEDAAAGGAGDADAGAGAGARGGVRELLGIMALGLKELGQGGVGLDLAGDKGVVLARGPGSGSAPP